MNKDINASKMFKVTNSFIEAYHKALQPLILETDLPPMAVDILMFIANNPENNTAKDICRLKGFKSSIVSFHVDNLVKFGFLKREEVENDRRKTKLVCTDKSKVFIEKGKKLQYQFASELAVGLSEEDLIIFEKCMNKFESNINRIKKEGIKDV